MFITFITPCSLQFNLVLRLNKIQWYVPRCLLQYLQYRYRNPKLAKEKVTPNETAQYIESAVGSLGLKQKNTCVCIHVLNENFFQSTKLTSSLLLYKYVMPTNRHFELCVNNDLAYVQDKNQLSIFYPKRGHESWISTNLVK